MESIGDKKAVCDKPHLDAAGASSRRQDSGPQRKLADVVLALNSLRSLDQTLRLITEQARAIIGAHQAITILPAGEGQPQAMVIADLSNQYAARRSTSLSPDLGRKLLDMHGSHPLRLTQAELAARLDWPNTGAEPGRLPMRGWLGAPLIGREGYYLGLIQLSDPYADEFSEEDEAILTQLAYMAATAIDQARLHQAVEDACAAAAAQRRLAFLSEASEILSSSLEYETRLSSLVRLVVPYLADWCTIDMLQDDGSLRRLAIAHADPLKEDAAYNLQQQYPRIKPEASHTILTVLRSGQAWVDPHVSETRLAAEARDAAHLDLLRSLGFKSEMVVPFVARGRALGTITFVRGDPDRPYGSADLELAEVLGRRAAMAVENARLYQEAQTSLQAREELLSVVSHDLKNPLASIKGYAQLLRRRIERLSIPETPRLLESLVKIDTASARMVAQIDLLLDAARLHAGQPLDLDPQRLDLVALVRQVAAERQQTTQQHNLQVAVGVPELFGRYDLARIERVFSNLLANAIKYSPQGGAITVEIMREPGDEADWAVVTVRDQGIGIPAGDLPRIFDRFHRAGNVARQIQGTGIGLSSARQIVEQHGGTIDVVSEEGVGSTFIVRLPVEIDEGVRE